jgi:hypothetical protein
VDIEVGVINGIILVSAGRNIPEWPGIDQFSAPEGGLEDLTVAPTTVNTSRTNAAHGDHTFGSIEGPGGFIGIGLLQIHGVILLWFIFENRFRGSTFDRPYFHVRLPQEASFLGWQSQPAGCVTPLLGHDGLVKIKNRLQLVMERRLCLQQSQIFLR